MKQIPRQHLGMTKHWELQKQIPRQRIGMTKHWELQKQIPRQQLGMTKHWEPQKQTHRQQLEIPKHLGRFPQPAAARTWPGSTPDRWRPAHERPEQNMADDPAPGQSKPAQIQTPLPERIWSWPSPARERQRVEGCPGSEKDDRPPQ